VADPQTGPAGDYSPPVTVVGIGADGWTGLSRPALAVIRSADVIAGSARQLDLLDGMDEITAPRHPWPTPMLPALQPFLAAHRGRRVVVVASGDPMYYGVGTILVRLLGASSVVVLPSPSSISLACARLGWAVDDVDVISTVGRPIELLYPALQPGRRVLVLVSDDDAAARIAGIVSERGFAQSGLVLLERLGAADERIHRATAATWDESHHDPLAVVAIECHDGGTSTLLPRVPGLADDAFDHDGQITKREIRAMTLAALAPLPGQLLWDVGAGSGSVGIEWMRCHPANRAVALEPRADRRERIERNATTLGVPGLQIVDGSAPGALADLPAPDAVFVGGAVSAPGVLEACVDAVPVGGRLVANAVTVEAEVALATAQHTFGGTLTRVSVQHAQPVGRFTGWRPAMPVTQWSLRKGAP
jgi:precorrin-6Y C5,15-methyltransferase (decarboxylating)